jgi:protein-S-isoprenylcysteine O-methyltransferase Ste14
MDKPQDTEPQQPAAEPLPEKVMAQLTELVSLLSLSGEQYKVQAQLTKQTAIAEMALSRRSLMLAAGLLVALGAGVVMLWGSVLVFTGYLLLQVTSSVLITAGSLFLLQIAFLYWCLRNMRYSLKQIGFSNTIAQVKGIFRFSDHSSGGDSVN